VRALFLLLLLANLLYFAWARWVAPPPQPAGYVAPAATVSGSIRLLSEVPAAQAAASSAAGTLSLDAADLACVSAGPFREPAGAERAAEQLRSLGFTVRLRASRDEVPVGHWVRLEGLATPEDAANAEAALRAAGIGEAFVVTEEGVGTVVSLGVYADAAKAAGIAAAARAAGFEPRTVEPMRTEDVTWLDVDRQANGGLPAIDELRGGEAGRFAELELRPCPDAAPAATGPANAEPAASVTPR